MLAPTAPGQPVSDPLSPEQARERVGGLMPEPYAPDRAALAAALEKQLGGKTDYSVLWLSDGLDYGEGDAFADSACQACRRAAAVSPCCVPRATTRRSPLARPLAKAASSPPAF